MLLLSVISLALAAQAIPIADQISFNLPNLPPAVDLGPFNHRFSASEIERIIEHVVSLPEPRLIKLSEDADPVRMTEGEKTYLMIAGKKFIDVTDQEIDFKPLTKPKTAFPALQYSKSDLKGIFKQIDIPYMKQFLSKFTSFRTRYYRSETGKQSQAFLLSTLKEIAATNNKVNITFHEVEHSWGQHSIVARFEPSKWKIHDAGLSSSLVIVGAHQDSTNMLPFLPAPGADDDGSGTTSSLAAFKALVESGFVPTRRPVEFHYYSAEEGGLLGSQEVAKVYQRKGTPVEAMLQIDMSAWVKKGTKETIGLVTDFVDADFTQYLREIINEYTEIGYTDTKCGYACSDHASWSGIGVPSGFAIESLFDDHNPNIHSTNDRIDYDEFSFEHMAEFSKIAVALALELGGGERIIKQ